MPKKEVTFTIKQPIEAVWSFMSDRKEVGCLFPGCQGVEILNDVDSIWRVRMNLGPFTRTLEMAAHTTEMVHHERIAWTAKHDDLTTSGITTFKALSANETEITYHIEGHVVGNFSFLRELVVAEKLGELTRGFMRGIKQWFDNSAE
jgi:carbon monoxide dehydrogenase subunit G